MKHIKAFEAKGDLVNISLPKNEYKLLISLLKDIEDIRSDMNCNDPVRREERLFSKEERIEMNKYLASCNYISKPDADDMEDYLYNNWYAAYILNKIKNK